MREARTHQTQHFPFSAWHGYPRVMPGAHVHTDIELNLFLAGGATYFLAGRFHEVTSGCLAIFWAGLPHRLVAVQQGAEYLCMTLPLAWFLSWGLDQRFTQRLLEGDLLVETAAEQSPLDRAQFSRWTEDIRSGAEGTRIALLEVEARLRRMAVGRTSPTSDPPGATSRVTGGRGSSHGHQMERMAEFIGERFREPLTVTDIAAAVELNPNYAMTAFREGCGLSLWEYVTRLRISHAQRLLLTTDWTVERIALDCGFGAASRFYAAFRRLCGVTPRQYRRQSAQWEKKRPNV